MSDPDFTAAVYDSQLGNLMNTAMSVLAVYEYIITVDQEVSSIWKRKATIASVLLLATRWTMLSQAVLGFVPPQTLTACKVESTVAGTIEVFTAILVAVFSGLRVYALWGGSMVLFIVVFLLELPPAIINTYGYVIAVYDVIPVIGCIENFNISLKAQLAVRYAARIPAVIGDAVVVGVTWFKSFQQLHKGRRLGMSLPLSTLLFRDGTIYFLILFVISVLELCTNLPESGQLFTYMTGRLPPMLINRFMLNLRQLGESESTSGTEHAMTFSTPMFRISADIIGNMGESLEYGGEEDNITALGGIEEVEMSSRTSVATHSPPIMTT